MASMTVTSVLVTTSCAECGIQFALPDWYDKKLRESGDTFWCPNKHSLWYGEGEAEKLKKRLARIEAERDRANTRALRMQDQKEIAERSRAAMKGQVTKIKKRVGKGVCPCCNRHFTDLQRHMEGQHPDFTE